jgi:hypothetical protein
MVTTGGQTRSARAKINSGRVFRINKQISDIGNVTVPLKTAVDVSF